jgi:peptidoglycan/xylan/chitin deacetylase (PgdA/CDA1 family)
MKTKIIFTLLLILAFAVIITGSVYKEEVSNYNLFYQTESQYNSLIELIRTVESQNTELSYCNPTQPTGPTIILRLDDIGAWNRYETSKIMVNKVLDYNYDIVLGVIPYNLEKDDRVVSWLLKLRDDDRVEIALHGYNHEPNEFKNLYTNESNFKILEGKEIFKKVIGTVPTTFIPPYNEYSIHLRQTLKDNNIHFFSAKENEYEIDGGVISLGFTTRTYDYSQEKFISNDEIISSCKSSLEKNNLCIILMHPEDISLKNEDAINEERFAQFKDLLNKLETLEAEFKTFEDHLDCVSLS